MAEIICPGSETFRSEHTSVKLGFFTASTGRAASRRAEEIVRADLMDKVNTTVCSEPFVEEDAEEEAEECIKLAGPLDLHTDAPRCRRFLIFAICWARAAGSVTVYCRRRYDANGVFDLEIDGGIPGDLACGSTYVFTASTEETVTDCQGYSYAYLYREALRYADERMADLHCPEPCQLNPYIVSQAGSCGEGFATVKLSMAVQCIPEGALPVNGLSLRGDSELRDPFQDALPDAPPSTHERLTVFVRPDSRATNCPYDFTFWITLRERVPSCDTVRDYTAFIEKAKRQATKIWQATHCGPNCRKIQPEEIGAARECTDNRVTLHYLFKVPCRPGG